MYYAAEEGRQVLNRVGDWLTSPVHQAGKSAWRCQNGPLKDPLIGEPTERAVAWRAAAALLGPFFLVLAEFARNNPPLLPAAWTFVSYKVPLFSHGASFLLSIALGCWLWPRWSVSLFRLNTFQPQ